jgi:hypothetical protein
MGYQPPTGRRGGETDGAGLQEVRADGRGGAAQRGLGARVEREGADSNEQITPTAATMGVWIAGGSFEGAAAATYEGAVSAVGDEDCAVPKTRKQIRPAQGRKHPR